MHKFYDVFNPTPGPRVIWDGITNAKPIRIASGETKKGVVLADHVVRDLRRSADLGPNADLRVTDSEEPAPAAEPLRAAPPGYAPGQYAQPRPPEAPPEAEDGEEAPTQPQPKKTQPRAVQAPARGKSKKRA